jgi:Mg-chelatase subunit ChlD
MNALEKLQLADPETFQWITVRLDSIEPLPAHLLDLLIDETIWGLSQEKGLAVAVAEAVITMIPKADKAVIHAYLRQIHRASRTGATLARILAAHLGPVLMAGPGYEKKFQRVVTVMQQKGTYTLNAPLELLSRLLAKNDRSAAEAYLDLLDVVFSQPMSYNQCLRLVYMIPRGVTHFAPLQRTTQILQLARVAETDLKLVDAFLEGLEKGLNLLPEQNLIDFVDQALTKYRGDPKSGIRFLNLTSKLGQNACAKRQVFAPLTLVRRRLNRYLSARLGRPFNVQSLAAVDAMARDQATWVCSNGRDIFLRDEIRHYDSQKRNLDLYLTLVRLEAGFFECDSFSFNLDHAAAMHPTVQRRIQANDINGAASINDPPCDALRFFRSFGHPQLAEDLFLILEMARTLKWTAARYPGLYRRIMPELEDEIDRFPSTGRRHHPLMASYLLLVHGQRASGSKQNLTNRAARILDRLFHASMDDESPVEVCAQIICRFFTELGMDVADLCRDYQPIRLPFGIRLRWDLFNSALKIHAEKARRIRMRLAQKKLTVNQRALQYQLLKHQGRLDAQDIKTLILTKARESSPQEVQITISETDLEALVAVASPETMDAGPNQGNAFSYPEWDHQINDYLQDYAWVREIHLPATGSDTFYRQALSRHRGLVAHIRRAFEYLKPEGMAILRQWPEGDAFDYRALLDFIVDRRAGRIPSERLYIKRLKQQRDVAVLVLVDLSRSTANPVAGKQTSVLNLTREALVLFCEAMEVVGDTYALAGFSGTGRHGVDYFRIKDYPEPLNREIRSRISALIPQRSTRMGAAIRHASRQLTNISARVRLMIIISDGFPNDLGYKADYAIADTRKAIQEARFQTLFVKAVTVNIGRDPRLDELYGRSHSHVIEDVNDLPAKLLRLYSTLTRPA